MGKTVVEMGIEDVNKMHTVKCCSIVLSVTGWAWHPPERNPNTINSNYTSKLKPLLQSFFPLFSGNIEECFSPKRESPTSIISNPGMTG